MKLSEAANIFEACMKHMDQSNCPKCPLYTVMSLEFGESPGDVQGQLTWQIQGCSMMAFFETWLKNKKPGQRA